MKPDSLRHGVTPYQWLVLFVAWLGWVFDSMDSTIYALVLQPALHDLLRSPGGGPVTSDVIGWYGGIIFSIFLVGWAIGGVVFGVLADQVLFAATWEIDFWGKYRRGIESDRAAYFGTIASYDDALVSLIADVASTYVNIRTLEERLNVARTNL